MKKSLVCILVLSMLLSLLVGCTKDEKSVTKDEKSVTTKNEDNKKSDDAEVVQLEQLDHVDLTMYLLGDRPADFDLVYEEVNKKLKEDINATLTVHFLGWGEFSEKYPLLFATGEEFDLIYTSEGCFYNQTALKGGFYEITEDMLTKYAPQTLANTKEDRWEQVRINGSIFMLPYTKPEYSNNVYVVRGDLMKKHGIEEINGFDDFIKYLDAVAANENNVVPYDDGSQFNKGNLANIKVGALNEVSPVVMNTQIAYNFADKDDLQLFNFVEQPEYLEYLKEAREWAGKGYWSQDAIVNGNTVKESFINGKSASAIVNLGDGNSIYMLTKEDHPEWDVRVYDTLDGRKTISRTGRANGMAINANSKNPERALMLLDLFKYDKEYYELTNYGIEGKHWERTEGNRFNTLPDFQNFPPVAACPWGWMTEGYEKTAEGAISNYDDIMNEWNSNLVAHPLQLFNFDDTAVKNEVAAVTTVIEEYMNALQLGYFEDVENMYNEFIAALESAGHTKIMNEFQRQIDENLK